ncbi:MAG: hypothetical protein M3M94_03280, partial [Actinomycetota bacterium]|nr:hypothetical protein [Actinomycetota bacterium]
MRVQHAVASRRIVRALPTVSVAAALVLLFGAATSLANTVVYVVNTTSDSALDPGCTAADCTLREAISDANASPTADRIEFNIGSGGAKTITPTSPLPPVTDAVVIDGTTQPGFDLTTRAPIVELNGSSAGGPGVAGLTLASDTLVRGLVINSFSGHGIIVGSGKSGVRIEGNYIGTNLAGDADLGNGQYGILVSGAAGTTIGGTTTGARNVISGNANGVTVAGGAASTTIQGNYIGTTADGAGSVPNAYGVAVDTSSGTLVGGSTVGAGNVISGNTNGGLIAIGSPTGAQIQGNYIGTNAAGTAALGNLHGVTLDSAGATLGGTTAAARNVISGNRDTGVVVSALGSAIHGNYIGTNAAGAAAVPNRRIGISVYVSDAVVGGSNPGEGNLISGHNDTSLQANPTGIAIGGGVTGVKVRGNLIGTNAAGTGAIANSRGITINGSAGHVIGGSVAGSRNVISGNAFGIQIANAGATGIAVLGNYIGTNSSGTAAVGNSVGIAIYYGSSNTIGGTTAAERNVVSGNGIGISVQGAAGNVIRGNYVGTQADGTAPLGNSAFGIRLTDVGSTQVGGVVPGSGNVVSANGSHGILVDGSGTASATIRGNYVGTKADGTGDLGNAREGIRVQTAGNTIGGTTSDARNVVSGNNGHGILVYGANDNVVQGNYAGTDVGGGTAVPNGLDGIAIDGGMGNSVGGTTGTTPGGACTGACNLASGNAKQGIAVFGVDFSSTANNIVQGNYAGLDATGTTVVPNGGDGIRLLNALNTLVGGGGATPTSEANAAARNVSAGNGGNGVGIYGVTSTGNTVTGNYIGTDTAGGGPLGNGGFGVYVADASVTRLGGVYAHPKSRNVIAFNGTGDGGGGGVGIVGSSAATNAVLGNSLHSNQGLGIDLGAAGVTPNDSGDADVGANGLQNFPVVSSATPDPEIADRTAVTWSLDTRPNTMYDVYFWSSTECDPSGNGEGTTHLATAGVQTGETGVIDDRVTLVGTAVPVGHYITMTAIETAGNNMTGSTSEFSNCVQVTEVDVVPENPPEDPALSNLEVTVDQRAIAAGTKTVALGSVPASELPVFSGSPQASPVGSIPVGSIPVGSIPVGSIPV